MTVAGEGRAPGREHAMELAESAGLKAGEAQAVVEEVLGGVAEWPGLAESLGLGEESIRAVERAIRAAAGPLR